MHVKAITQKGVTRLYIYETIYVKDPADGKGHIRSKLLKCLGRLDELQKTYDDPIAHFKEVCRQRTEEEKASRDVIIHIDPKEKMDENIDDTMNVGYGILKKIYLSLGMNKFWNWKSRYHNTQYSVDQIFRLLVLARILYPESKKKTYEDRHIFFEGFDGFSLDDIYDSLDIIAENKEAMQKWLFEHSNSICQRDVSISYFDCTNYYFDISRPDVDIMDDEGNVVDKDGNPAKPRYRKRGPEKNHRPDPIVEMGLLMDKNGIPLAYDLFPGNESEKVHMRPIINKFKQQFPEGRTIFVADRGLNTSDNIYWLNGDNKADNNTRDGYVYGQSVRTADQEFKAWVLSDGYNIAKVKDKDSDDMVEIKYKSRITPRAIHVNLTDPVTKKKHKKQVIIDQKQLVYYSEKYAKKQRADREAMIARAKDLIKHPKKYDRATAAGSAAYVINISFNKDTGEVVEGKNLVLDEEKIREQEKYDGYYSIVTSELNISDKQLHEIYDGLSRIEDAFKITKTDFNARPVYLWNDDHIDAHFAICFTALVIVRLLQTILDNEYPIGKVLESLRKYNCYQYDPTYYKFVFIDDIIRKCSDKFNLELDCRYRTLGEIRRLLQY